MNVTHGCTSNTTERSEYVSEVKEPYNTNERSECTDEWSERNE